MKAISVPLYMVYSTVHVYKKSNNDKTMY